MSEPHYNRFVGLDIHKITASFAIVDRRSNLLDQGTIFMTDLPRWAEEHLTKEDQVIIEATGNSYHVYDQLSPLVGEVQIAHMLAMHDRTCSRKKPTSLMPLN